MGKLRPGSEDPEDYQGATRQDFGATKVTKAHKDGKAKVERRNTAVYVTSLPSDTTVEEVHEVFSKYGIIAEEIDTGDPRIKLYTNDDGTLKGDALVVYFRPESVSLAIQMLDDSDFRYGTRGPDGPMRVKEADRTYKKQQDAPAAGTKTAARDKAKIIQRTEKLNAKLADWDDDDPVPEPTTQPSKWDKVVILKHMFTLKELEDDAGAALDIKMDVREECEKLGEVTNVTLYDLEQDGVVSVRFTDPLAAKASVKLMGGRIFGGQTVEAYVSPGQPKFKKTKKKKDAAVESDSDDERRAEKFGDWLESKNEDKIEA